MQATYRRRVNPNEVVSAELARHISELSRETGRQVGVLIGRRGAVEHVIVGDALKLELPDVGRARAGEGRLRGLRLVHTHLRGEPLTRDDLTDLALLRLDLVCAIQSRPDGLPGSCHVGWLKPGLVTPEAIDSGTEPWVVEDAPDVHSLDIDPLHIVAEVESELARTAQARRVDTEDRAILIGVALDSRERADASMLELQELARTAGVEVIDTIIQPRQRMDSRFVVGEGKLEELDLRAMQLMVDLLIFDTDLSPSQSRHLADRTSLRILDRTQLILDIFAQRARSADGKLQVELAQLQYMLPRLSQRDDALSRLTGGIGGRGPGETKLEVDRRRVRDRIAQLQRRIDALSSERQVRRRQRVRQGLPVVSIVGYTNAGKSTLLNSLTRSEVLAEDKLFATLDPTSRRLRFPREREVIITDTVGFIRALPKTLVNAFRATLEELEDADLLLHVVDASDPEHEEQIAAVERILKELDLLETPRLLVFNKADLLSEGEADALAHQHDGLALSATTGQGFRQLLERAESLLWREGKVSTPGDEPFAHGSSLPLAKHESLDDIRDNIRDDTLDESPAPSGSSDPDLLH